MGFQGKSLNLKSGLISLFFILGLVVISTLCFENCSNSNSGGAPNAASGTPSTPYQLYLQDLAGIPARQTNHGFPRLAIDTQVSFFGNAANGFLGQQLFSRLHWFDFVVVDANTAVVNTFDPGFGPFLGRTGSIRSLNPNTVVTAYFSIADYDDDAKGLCYQPFGSSYAFGSDFSTKTCLDSTYPGGADDFDIQDWLFHDPTGAPIKLFQYADGSFSHIPDPNKLGMRQRYVTTFNNLVVSNYWVDGIYHDWGGNSVMPNLGPAPGYTVSQGVSLLNNGVNNLVNIGNVNDPVNVEWQTGVAALYALGRSTYPPNFVMVGNSGWGSDPVRYTNYLQGTQLENFMGCVQNAGCGWQKAMYTYGTHLKTGQTPNFGFIQVNINNGTNPADSNHLLYDLMISTGNNWITEAEFAELRFGLASALMFDGYFATDNSNGAYQAALWVDEFSVDSNGNGVAPTDATAASALANKGWLGAPKADAYNVSAPTQTLWSVIQAGGLSNNSNTFVWRRDFANGITLVNPTSTTQTVTLGGTFHMIKGVVDPTFNAGTTGITSVVLPSQTGIVLINN